MTTTKRYRSSLDSTSSQRYSSISRRDSRLDIDANTLAVTVDACVRVHAVVEGVDLAYASDLTWARPPDIHCPKGGLDQYDSQLRQLSKLFLMTYPMDSTERRPD